MIPVLFNCRKHFARCIVGLLAAVVLLAGLLPASAERTAHPIPIRFPKRGGRVTVHGLIQRFPVYAFRASAGHRLRLTFQPPPGVALAWHITFPSGKEFGTKGYDAFDGHLTETGRYLIAVGINNMATDARTGRFAMTLRLR